MNSSILHALVSGFVPVFLAFLTRFCFSLAPVMEYCSLIISGCFWMILFLMIYDGGCVQLWQSHITLKVIRILFVSQVMPSKRDADFSRDVHKAVSSRMRQGMRQKARG